MLIRGLKFPEQLLDAHRTGQLVIFVGAGASQGPPASLPLFKDLAATIARAAPITVEKERLENPDVLLGDLETTHNVGVHERVSEIIAKSEGTNRLHEAVAGLVAAGSGAVPRIVTTNFDTHLTTALRKRGVLFDEYRAPALPLGDDFKGLVYLHGCVAQDQASKLVVTDVDFGRAYLRDAWAARFLERMFATYTVLFVGYSHNDVVMTYMARSLSSDSKRYALAPEREDSEEPARWRRLGITLIGYPNPDDTHCAVPAALEYWAELESNGLMGHRRRIGELVAVPPSQVPDEVSYLEYVLADPVLVTLFAEQAEGEEWLRWASTHQPFKQAVFNPDLPRREREPLAEWFAARFVMDEKLSKTALLIVAAAGGELSPAACAAIGREIARHGDQRPTWLSPWLALLVSCDRASGATSDWLDYALADSTSEMHKDDALLLFEHLAQPRLTYRAVVGAYLSGEERLRGEQHWLDQSWEAIFKPRLEEFSPQILPIVDHHIRQFYRLLKASGVSWDKSWDPLGSHRAAIEPSAQNGHRQPVDSLIDPARDCIESLLDREDRMAALYLQGWLSSGLPLLRRLAIHGWDHRTDVDDDAKLRWLVSQEWTDLVIWHEVAALLSRSLGACSPEIRDELVQAAARMPQQTESQAYRRFTVLAWIAKHDPNADGAKEYLAQARLEHPHFEERDHPEFVNYFERSSPDDSQPLSAEELRDLLCDDPESAVQQVLAHRGDQNRFGVPTGQDTLKVLATVVAGDPEMALKALPLVSDQADVVRAIALGLSRANLDEPLASETLNALAETELAVTGAGIVTGMLCRRAPDDISPAVWHSLPAGWDLANKVWDHLPSGVPPDGTDDWLVWSLAQPGSGIAEFWTNCAAARWARDNDAWGCLPDEIKQPLEGIVGGVDDRAIAGQIFLASQTRFFLRADRQWCITHVLPLMDWKSTASARRYWDGFLHWGGWDDQLLESGLKDYYLEAVYHISEFTQSLQHQLIRHLADVALYADPEVVEKAGWLARLTRGLPPASRIKWINEISCLLPSISAPAVTGAWDQWMKQYWSQRTHGIPDRLDREEASAMADWVAFLGDRVPEGVPLATSTPASIKEDSCSYLLRVPDEQLNAHPQDYAKLFAHLLPNTNPSSSIRSHLPRILETIRPGTDEATIRQLQEQALRLGCG